MARQFYKAVANTSVAAPQCSARDFPDRVETRSPRASEVAHRPLGELASSRGSGEFWKWLLFLLSLLCPEPKLSCSWKWNASGSLINSWLHQRVSWREGPEVAVPQTYSGPIEGYRAPPKPVLVSRAPVAGKGRELGDLRGMSTGCLELHAGRIWINDLFSSFPTMVH